RGIEVAAERIGLDTHAAWRRKSVPDGVRCSSAERIVRRLSGEARGLTERERHGGDGCRCAEIVVHRRRSNDGDARIDGLCVAARVVTVDRDEIRTGLTVS